MEFVYPFFLSALIALSIPILIHLFNLKRFKKVVFPNVRLLKTIEFETKSQSKLRHLLILISRLLALLFIVLAFTQPFIPAKKDKLSASKNSRTLCIYIDNSFSMAALKENRSLFDEAKEIAAIIAEESEASAAFQLITNDFSANEEIELNKEQFLKALDKLQLSPTFKTLSEVAVRQRELSNFSDNTQKQAYLISDFQKVMLDLSNFPTDSLLSYNLLPVYPNEFNNIYIDSVWFDSPIRQFGAMENLNVRIVNEADERLEGIPVKLYINEEQKTPAIIDLQANSSKVISLNYVNATYGNQNGKVVIRDYPVNFDDEFYFSYTIDSLINVLVINGGDENKAVNKIYGSEGFSLTNQNQKQVDYGAFSRMNLIVLNGLKNTGSGLLSELNRFLDKDGSLIVIPTEDADSESFEEMALALKMPQITGKDTSNTLVDAINTQSLIYKNVFEEVPRNANLPLVNQHFTFSESKLRNYEDLLPLKSGDWLLRTYFPGSGKIFLFSAPLTASYGNFTKHSLIVPTFYNIALQSLAKQRLFYTIGKDNSIKLQRKGETESVYHIKNESADVVPETQVIGNDYRLFLHNSLKTAGNSMLFAETTVDTLSVSFNYERKESSLMSLTYDQLSDFIAENGIENTRLIREENNINLASIISFTNRGKPLWKYCIILAVLFIFSEMLLTKLWK